MSTKSETSTLLPYFDADWYRSHYAGVCPVGVDPLDYYLRHGEEAGHKPNPIFNPIWYRRTYLQPDDRSQNALAHYVNVGRAAGARPHPLFWSDWYEKTSGCRSEPFLHYLTQGWRTLNPNPVFDAQYYRRQAGISLDVNPLAHYVVSGSRIALSPHPLFDPTWYLASEDAQLDPLSNYLLSDGMTSPHPLFDPKFYRKQARPDEVLGNPLVHFLERGAREGRSPHSFFSVPWYLRNVPDARKEGVNPLIHYLSKRAARAEPDTRRSLFRCAHEYYLSKRAIQLEPQRRRSIVRCLYEAYHFRTWRRAVAPEFDTSFYLADNPDVQLTGMDPIEHYLRFGWRDGRRPAPDFDVAYYLEANPDVARSGIEPFTHYIMYGRREGRAPQFRSGADKSGGGLSGSYPGPHPLFDANYYMWANPDVARMEANPLLHYLRTGFKDGRKCRPQRWRRRYAKRAPRPPIELSTTTSSVNMEKLSKGSAEKGVFAHIFYEDLSEEIVLHCNHVPPPCRVFITTDRHSKAALIAQIFQAKSEHPFEIRVAPNRGRDIAPMLVTFADKFDEVEFAVHVHTKRSPHFPGRFDEWRRYLLESNLGTPQLVANILALFDCDRVGAVAPADHPEMARLVHWGSNLSNAQGLISLIGEEINVDVPLECPTGSMFWFRTAALRPLLDLGLEFFHFDPEQGQTDGTLAHSIERCFFYFVEIAGYDWLRFRALESEGRQLPKVDLNNLDTAFAPILSKRRGKTI